MISSSQRPLPDSTQHLRQTSTPPVGFEPLISAGERPQTYTLDRAATGIGRNFCCRTQIMTLRASLYSSSLQLGPPPDVIFSAPFSQTILISHSYEHSSSCMHTKTTHTITFNPLKPELSSICYLLALLGAHHFLHVSRIRVKLLTFRLLLSYIYGAPILDVSRSHTTTQHSR